MVALIFSFRLNQILFVHFKVPVILPSYILLTTSPDPSTGYLILLLHDILYRECNTARIRLSEPITDLECMEVWNASPTLL